MEYKKSIFNVVLASVLFLVFLKTAAAENGDIKYRLALDMTRPKPVNVDQPIDQNERLAFESVEIGEETVSLKEISKTRYIVGGLVATLPLSGMILFDHLRSSREHQVFAKLESFSTYSTMLSPGLGHIIQGRWKGKGQIFTFGQLAALAAMRIDRNLCLNERKNKESDGLFGWLDCVFPKLSSVSFLFGMAFAALKTWEIIDIWFPSRSKYTIGSKNNKKVGFAILPFKNTANGSGLRLAFSLSY